MMNPITSRADAVHPRFTKFVRTAALFGQGDPDQSEADTRAKLIDPIFKDILGWGENDIKREEPAADGFADYSIGEDFKWFHIEAKRTAPRFRLMASSRPRTLKLSGPHLLRNKTMKPLLEQAVKYAPSLGTQFAVLTNGSQFVIFEAMRRGRGWEEGLAIVWHDHEDIDDNFAEFYNLLARECVEAGSLVQAFSKDGSITTPMYTPLAFMHNPDGELVRNPFWTRISQAFSPILIDQPENARLQEEIVKHCYVSTSLGRESKQSLGNLLHDMMPSYVRRFGGSTIDPTDRTETSFEGRLIDDLKRSKPGAYLLTGGVGSGKTSFLRRFATVDQHAQVRDHCVWLHIDYSTIGSVLGVRPGEDADEYLRQQVAQIEPYTHTRIREILQEKYPRYVAQNGEQLRRIFQPEIDELCMTLLYGVDEASPEFRTEVNRRVDQLVKDRDYYLHAILRYIKRDKKSLVFILDNTDQEGEDFQRAAFLYAQKLSDSYSTLAIVSLREEKFFAAYKRGVFNAFGTRTFHIGSPDLIEVLKKRLNYGLNRYLALANDDRVPLTERTETERVIRALIESSTLRNGNIIRFLVSVSSGDMRLALKMFADFMSSGNTDTEKILRIESRRGQHYRMPFHEFAKSAVLGARRYYKSAASRILNVFALTGAKNSSHWTASRILARMASSQHVSSTQGEGYVATSILLRECRESFGIADDFIEKCHSLLQEGLLESEPPRVFDVRSVEALRITATGSYYWSFLIRSFAYLDLILVDTPIRSEALARELGILSERRKEDYAVAAFMSTRIERVRKFLDYLKVVDEEEIESSSRQGGPYNECLSKEIIAQIDKEILVLREKTGAENGADIEI